MLAELLHTSIVETNDRWQLSPQLVIMTIHVRNLMPSSRQFLKKSGTESSEAPSHC